MATTVKEPENSFFTLVTLLKLNKFKFIRQLEISVKNKTNNKNKNNNKTKENSHLLAKLSTSGLTVKDIAT